MSTTKSPSIPLYKGGRDVVHFIKEEAKNLPFFKGESEGIS
jgi:hypothetical protein